MSSIVVASTYKPRAAFSPFHSRHQRYAVLVCHRRAGKTVSTVNDIVDKAIRFPHIPDKPGKFGYVAPFKTQAKDAAWRYFKAAVRHIPGVKMSDHTLEITLPKNEVVIKLYGADDPDSIRGSYFDGVVLDEYGDMKSRVYSEVIRPMIADRDGFVVFIGTPRGKNNFYKQRELARKNPHKYYYLELKASESGLIDPRELEEIKEVTDEDEYEIEFECNFDAAVKGSYYAKYVNEIEAAGHVTNVPIQRAFPVHTAWDLGRRDATSIWFYQLIQGEIHVVDFYETSNVDIQEILLDVADKNYKWGTFWLPHDARAKTLATRKSVIEQVLAEGFTCQLAPDLAVRDGIQAVRMTLKDCWFDEGRCGVGVERLKNYQREYNADRQEYAETPLHDINSHAADAFRYLCLAVSEDTLKDSKKQKKRKKPAPPKQPEQQAQEYVRFQQVNINNQPRWTLDELFEAQPRRYYGNDKI